MSHRNVLAIGLVLVFAATGAVADEKLGTESFTVSCSAPAQQAGDRDSARAYHTKLLALAEHADSDRPEMRAAREFLAKR